MRRIVAPSDGQWPARPSGRPPRATKYALSARQASRQSSSSPVSFMLVEAWFASLHRVDDFSVCAKYIVAIAKGRHSKDLLAGDGYGRLKAHHDLHVVSSQDT